MNLHSVPALVLLLSANLTANTSMRIGLDTQGTEWLLSMDGGGDVCARSGKVIMRLKDGEKLRIWWDSRGEADPTDEYRIQVGPAMDLKDAEALMAKLKEMGEQPDRHRVADGGTWRVLTGHFAKAEDGEAILQKLNASGFNELWISTEPRPGKPRKGRALYAVTDRYERRPLPAEGVSFRPKGGITTVQNKGRYRGTIDIYPNVQGRLTVMNTLELETYLRGVVPREMGPGIFPALEALKAQAVAARTYAYANRGKRAGEGFDLLDTVADQVYGGAEGEANLSDRAVAETKGLIAIHGGKPIQALYMANSGGATLDNHFVFGGNTPYLKGASNYSEATKTLRFKGIPVPEENQPWLGLELLRMVSSDVIPVEWLSGERLAQVANPADLKEPVDAIARRLELPKPAALVSGASLFLWMARSLGLGQVVEGMERTEDANYFLGELNMKASDKPLASMLARRGIVPPGLWKMSKPTQLQCLQVLGRIWNEIETPEILEGTLLLDGQIRPKNNGPQPFKIAPKVLLAEEAPGGSLRLLSETAVQVGDKLKWIPQEGGTRLIVRRLDPDGASLDRYNPTAHWKVELTEQELLGRLRARAGAHGLHRLELKHNEHGRVLELIVHDGARRSHRFTGMRIRGLLGLKDNVFRYMVVGSGAKRRYLFYGRGWGHGVGMDQSGAYGMALEGASFEQILKHYYHGIELSKMP